MKYLSVCSGIEAATVAWEPLGWEPLAFSEIEPFPSAVLAHHWPHVPNLGDFTTIERADLTDDPDLLIGGTPCQAFSVAGLRQSLGDERGNLTLEFVRLADRLDPEWIVWENVPGVLGGLADNPFGCFLAGIVGADEPLRPTGKRWADAGIVLGPRRRAAWRILDAQWFGVAQRRRRVFVVACPTDGADPAAVLLEWDGVRRDTPPSREPREGVADGSARGVGIGGDLAQTLTVMAPAFSKRPGQQIATRDDGACFALTSGEPCRVLDTEPVGFYPTNRQPEFANYEGVSPAVKVGSSGSSGNPPAVVANMAVRRLTPVECERLQGFPDDHTRIPWRKKPAEDCPDGPRYKAIGNSMAVPVIRWIGERIEGQ